MLFFHPTIINTPSVYTHSISLNYQARTIILKSSVYKLPNATQQKLLFIHP